MNTVTACRHAGSQERISEMKTTNKTTLTMKQIPLSEQPYTLMEQEGAEHLTDAQLLAVFLKNGSEGERALDLATRMLCEAASLEEDPLLALMTSSTSYLESFKGIGRIKAMQLRSISELARRLSSRQARKRFSVQDPSTVAAIYMEEMRHRKQEVIKAVYLTIKNEILTDRTISIGTIDRAIVAPREVFMPALEKGGVHIILIHNHPSGDPRPSENDIQMTTRLVACGQLLELPILDHIVIGDGTYYSMREHGVLT
jgi:DNA repair protein RadC